MKRLLCVLMLTITTACASSLPSPLGGEPEAARTRAALASVTVDNRTQFPLTILYTLTTRASVSVTIGRVDSLSVGRMAPVPAGEPIVVFARNSRGDVLTLPPRSFEIDGAWTWTIPIDARFTAPPRRL